MNSMMVYILVYNSIFQQNSISTLGHKLTNFSAGSITGKKQNLPRNQQLKGTLNIDLHEFFRKIAT